MEDHNKADEKYYLASNMILKLANKAYKLFESSKEKQKRQLLSLILQNCQLAGKKLEFSLKTPFDAIYNCSKSADWRGLADAFRTINWKEALGYPELIIPQMKQLLTT